MSRPEPIPALTGLRIIGAGWVVLFHFKDTIVGASAALRPAEPFFSLGTSGVPLFFLLSGYIIWHNYGSARLFRSVREPVRFFWRRVARLWPVNVLTLCLAAPLIMNAVIVHGFWGQPLPPWYSVSGFIGSALMVQVLRYPEAQYPWNQPSWSLTAEMVAYVVFPLILFFALRIRAAKLRWVCVPLALVLASVAYLPGFSFPYRWLVELLVLFVAGVLLRVAGRPRTSLAMSILQVVAPIVIIVACFSPAYTFIPTLLAVWVWSLAAPAGWMVRLMTTRPMQVAGLSSYSVYMLHWVILGYAYLLVEQSPPTGVGKKVFVIIALLAVASGSWLCWRFFETPGRKVLNAAFERVWPGPRPVTVTEETLEHEAGVERHHTRD